MTTRSGWGKLEFHSTAWTEIAEFLGGMAARHQEFAHVAAVVDSVITSESTSLLAGCTSMHDLVVVPQPIPEPPFAVIIVAAPGSLRQPPTGHVIVDHVSVTGQRDRIVRPVADTIPLFWRFVAEKYGITPRRPPAPADKRSDRSS